MLRAVGAGVGRRYQCEWVKIGLKVGGGSTFRQSVHFSSALLGVQSRCSSTSSIPQSSYIDVPQTCSSSIASMPSGSSITVSGWLTSRRRIGKSLSFAVLLLPRGQGKLQLIAKSKDNTEENRNIAIWDEAGNHGVVMVKGELQHKPSKDLRQEQKKSNQLSHLELHITETKILNSVPNGTLPFDPLHDHHRTNDYIRMKHRYLDLRGDRLGHNIRLRSKVSWAIRNHLHQLDFTEIETPVLLRSTPEGAREYLVPTRVNGKQASPSDASSSKLPTKSPQFFALQQSPQQPKQLLMASGVTDRYFQIAKCFRDEDGRKDRQAEFTQIDLEMSFISGEEVQNGEEKGWRIGGREVKTIIEGMIKTVWRSAGRVEEADELEKEGFRVIQYDEAMQKYGSDKPDLRYGLELVELGEVIADEQEEIDGSHAKNDVELLCFTPPTGSFSNAEMDQLFGTNSESLQGVERFKAQAGSTNSMAKVLMRKSQNVRTLLEERGILGEDVSVASLVGKVQEALERGMIRDDIESGDVSFLFTSLKKVPASGGMTKLGDLRRLLMASLVDRSKVKLTSKPHFAWVTEFPLFTLDDDDKAELSKGRWNSSHHPFTSPMQKDIDRIKRVLSHDTNSPTISTAEKQRIMLACKGQHYDLVLNGVEIGGGSVRIHDAILQESILKNALQLTSSELSRFNHLLQALTFGAPPHGGIALGFDRLMAILCETETIRDVMAFPKSATSKDLLFQCPDTLDPGTSLEAYGLKSASEDNSPK